MPAIMLLVLYKWSIYSLEQVERLLREATNERAALQQQLVTERQRCSQLEDQLSHAHQQLELQQRLSEHVAEQVT
jgi:hypothetical protein